MDADSEHITAAASAAISKLKVAGSWSGVLEVPLDRWTVPMLRAEIARRSGGGQPPEFIKLISGGKVIRDGRGDSTLAQAGLKNNAKILASRSEPAGAQMAAEERRFAEAELSETERALRLSRIRAAAEKLAARHMDGSLPLEDYNIELEDQDGNKINFGSETDQRGIMMGLMLHANGKKLIKKRNYKDALDILTMGEEVFSLCDPKVIEMVDNVPMLQIDMVWCYFMLQDISWLSMAGIRLADARKGFEHSHGKDTSRLRLLQGGRHAELAIYLRLELLEGVVAYHTGQFEKSRKLLSSAQDKYRQLEITDEALSLLMSMGYKERAAKRALRMTNQDISSAVDFLVEERAKRARRHEEDIQRQSEILEQKVYGMTPLKKAVDIQRLNELSSIGFERILAAEALRVNENDTQKALDDLTNPETNAKLQLQLEKRKQRERDRMREAEIDALVAMGYDRSAVTVAFRDSESKDAALNMLAAAATQESNLDRNAESSSGHSLADPVDARNAAVDTDANEDGIEVERDLEMEDEITSGLVGDALADYDIEVSLEGEAISQYLAMLEATRV